MAEPDRIRLEIAFEGGQVADRHRRPRSADELDRALADGRDGRRSRSRPRTAATRSAVRKIVFVKRFARESRVGFGA